MTEFPVEEVKDFLDIGREVLDVFLWVCVSQSRGEIDSNRKISDKKLYPSSILPCNIPLTTFCDHSISRNMTHTHDYKGLATNILHASRSAYLIVVYLAWYRTVIFLAIMLAIRNMRISVVPM